MEYQRVDTHFTRALRAVDTSSVVALPLVGELVRVSRAHRLLALWLVGECFQHSRKEMAMSVVPLEGLALWDQCNTLDHLLVSVGQSALQEEALSNMGRQSLDACYAGFTCCREACLAELLTTGVAGFCGQWDWSETLYFAAVDADGQARKAARLHWVRNQDPHMVVGKMKYPLTIQAARELSQGTATPRDVIQGFKGDMFPMLWVSKRSALLYCEGAWIEWETDVVLRCSVSDVAQVVRPGSRVFATTDGHAFVVLHHDVIRVLVDKGSAGGETKSPRSRMPPVLEKAFQSPSFWRLSLSYDEYALGVSLLNPRMEKPAWMGKDYDHLDDWYVILDSTRDVATRFKQNFGRQVARKATDPQPSSSFLSVMEEEPVVRDFDGDEEGHEASVRESDPSMYWVNERTLLSWLPPALFLGASAVQMIRTVSRPGQISGLVMAPFAVLVALYALLRFLLRNRALLRGQGVEGFGVVDLWGPWVLIPVIAAVQIVIVVVMGPR